MALTHNDSVRTSADDAAAIRVASAAPFCSGAAATLVTLVPAEVYILFAEADTAAAAAAAAEAEDV